MIIEADVVIEELLNHFSLGIKVVRENWWKVVILSSVMKQETCHSIYRYAKAN